MKKVFLSEHRSSFTLIELLVVIAIISILAAMIFPALNNAKEHGRSSFCKNNLKSLAMFADMYANENNDYYFHSFYSTGYNGYPAANNTWQKHLIYNLMIDHKVLACPSNQRSFTGFGTDGTKKVNYMCNRHLFPFGTDIPKSRKHIIRASSLSLFFDALGDNNNPAKLSNNYWFWPEHKNRADFSSSPHRKNINLAYADSHVGNIPVRTLQEAESTDKLFLGSLR